MGTTPEMTENYHHLLINYSSFEKARGNGWRHNL